MSDQRTESARPNFVLFVTDQHRADYLGCTGHPVLKTPNVDSIAARGTVFERAYVANPVCMPNRASLMTGRMSSVTGVRQNGNDLPKHMRTFAQVLRASGYDTALLGKAHLQTMTEIPAPIGKNPVGKGPLANAVYIGDESEFLAESGAEWRSRGPAAAELPYYGFDRADIVAFHGDMTGCAHEHWVRAQGVDPATIRGPQNQLPHNYACPQAVRTAVPEELYSTAYVRDMACDFLGAEARHDKPFFACISFPDPHHPFTPPGKYWDMYDPDDMAVPSSGQTHRNPPPHLAWLREQPTVTGEKFYTEANLQEPRILREAMALTCGMLAMIDDAVGAVLQLLERAGLADNTIVAFTSDHGDYLGHHGLLFKGGMHFQSLVRVPFIWADPRIQQPSHSQALVSTIDLAPTFMAQAGAIAYDGIQGLDLSDTIAGNAPVTRSSVLIEEDSYFTGKLSFDKQMRIRTLVTERHRLSIYHGVDWGELYDLENDPDETFNLWDEPAYAELRQSLLWELTQSMLGYADKSPWPKWEA